MSPHATFGKLELLTGAALGVLTLIPACELARSAPPPAKSEAALAAPARLPDGPDRRVEHESGVARTTFLLSGSRSDRRACDDSAAAPLRHPTVTVLLPVRDALPAVWKSLLCLAAPGQREVVPATRDLRLVAIDLINFLCRRGDARVN